MPYTLNKQLIRMVINTLKSLDVRGYESISSVVGLVTLFENILKLPTPKEGEDNGIDNNSEP